MPHITDRIYVLRQRASKGLATPAEAAELARLKASRGQKLCGSARYMPESCAVRPSSKSSTSKLSSSKKTLQKEHDLLVMKKQSQQVALIAALAAKFEADADKVEEANKQRLAKAKTRPEAAAIRNFQVVQRMTMFVPAAAAHLLGLMRDAKVVMSRDAIMQAYIKYAQEKRHGGESMARLCTLPHIAAPVFRVVAMALAATTSDSSAKLPSSTTIGVDGNWSRR
jgi:hypothetical protein